MQKEVSWTKLYLLLLQKIGSTCNYFNEFRKELDINEVKEDGKSGLIVFIAPKIENAINNIGFF